MAWLLLGGRMQDQFLAGWRLSHFAENYRLLVVAEHVSESQKGLLEVATIRMNI